ncbi:MAG TPA: hypothetical protein VMP13_05275 [Acidimicrobiia bacterium]|nr:hypothetical protein [Acidimicrobiia bacterium]
MVYLTHPDSLNELLPGQPDFRADQFRAWLYQTPFLDAVDMTNLPLQVREKIRSRLWPFEVESADEGTTRKWLFHAPDGAAVEAVLMG